MASESLEKKIQTARANAGHEVPMARLCAKVVHALIQGQDLDEVQKAVDEMKVGCGNGWSATVALQFMSGRRGQFAAEAAPHGEQAGLMVAHLVAKDFCNRQALGGVKALDGNDVAKLRALVQAAKSGQLH